MPHRSCSNESVMWWRVFYLKHKLSGLCVAGCPGTLRSLKRTKPVCSQKSWGLSTPFIHHTGTTSLSQVWRAFMFRHLRSCMFSVRVEFRFIRWFDLHLIQYLNLACGHIQGFKWVLNVLWRNHCSHCSQPCPKNHTHLEQPETTWKDLVSLSSFYLKYATFLLDNSENWASQSLLSSDHVSTQGQSPLGRGTYGALK